MTDIYIFLKGGFADDETVDIVSEKRELVKKDLGRATVLVEEVSTLFAALTKCDQALLLRVRWAFLLVRYAYVALAVQLRGIDVKNFIETPPDAFLESWQDLATQVALGRARTCGVFNRVGAKLRLTSPPVFLRSFSFPCGQAHEHARTRT